MRVTSKPEEIKQLLAVGFEYVCEKRRLDVLQKAQMEKLGLKLKNTT